MSEMAQSIYTNEYVGKSQKEKMEAFYKIVEQFDPFIEKTINELYKERFDLKEQSLTREGFKFDLINGTSNQPASSLYGLVNSYKPEKGGALAQYVMQYLKDRGKRVLDQRLKNKARAIAPKKHPNGQTYNSDVINFKDKFISKHSQPVSTNFKSPGAALA